MVTTTIRARLAAGSLSAILAAGVTGCVSATDVTVSSAGGAIATPSFDAESACPPLTGAELSGILDRPFNPDTLVIGDDADRSECRWLATDGDGLVVAVTYKKDPKTQFADSFRNAQRSLGPTHLLKVKGTQAAFTSPAVGRFGLLTENAYIELSTIVPGITADQLRRLLDTTVR